MTVDTYTGRLVADGNGNLLADEGDRKGEPVAYDEGQYIFVAPGEPSHNERHHQRFAEAVPLQDQDPDLPGYAGTADDPAEGAEHFFVPIEEREPLSILPDAMSARISGHTDQGKEA